MLQGFLFGLGFFLSFSVFIFLGLVLIAALKKAASTQKFTIAAFQNYARKLRTEEKYEELRIVKSIVIAMQDGEKPDSKLLEAYEMKTESKLKVKPSGIAIKKVEYIVRKPVQKKKN